MESPKPAHSATRDYEIAVRGELTAQFFETLGPVTVEPMGDETIISFAGADQAKLQSVLAWLYERGIEIVSIAPDHLNP